jgi:cytochrome b subunit of formate dehydrogenase
MKKEFERFTLIQIIQHLAWLWAFLVLAATGLSFKFAHTSVAQVYVDLIGGYESRRMIHRIAAGVLIGTGVFHILYYTLTNRGPKAIVPTRKDLSDFVMHWKYLLRRSDQMPQFSRFTWYEKFEYWAGGFGTAVMATTGLLMWLKYDLTMKILPLAVINIARRVHGWEATLAVLFLGVFHLYMNIWRPGVFPMAGHWISGVISRDKMVEEHPLELEELERND